MSYYTFQGRFRGLFFSDSPVNKFFSSLRLAWIVRRILLNAFFYCCSSDLIGGSSDLSAICLLRLDFDFSIL
jgi:hypothetical protein